MSVKKPYLYTGKLSLIGEINQWRNIPSISYASGPHTKWVHDLIQMVDGGPGTDCLSSCKPLPEALLLL